ncbi:hypothetical protein [Catenibacterium sp.]|uniref:hypothetical protein n=1 Tax=Catenibacterium sp. TaxID=2049022 RepID=UPI00399391FE
MRVIKMLVNLYGSSQRTTKVFTENIMSRSQRTPIKIEDKIEDKIEENPNPKTEVQTLFDLPLDKQVELLEEALENMNYQ